MSNINGRLPNLTTRFSEQTSPTTDNATITTTYGISYIHSYQYQIDSNYSSAKARERLINIVVVVVVVTENNINSSYAHNLAMAIQSNNKDKVKILLTENRNLNEVFYTGDPILLSAFRQNNKEIINMLLEKGADINLIYASASEPENCIPTTMFLSALARNNNLKMASLLIEQGANVDQPNSSGLTPLIWYVVTGNTERINFLISSGAKIDLQDKTGKTALTWAVYNGQLEAVKILLKHEADPNIADIYGKTALFHTAMQKQNQTEAETANKQVITELLQEHGAESPKIIYNKNTGELYDKEFITNFNENTFNDTHSTSGIISCELAKEINERATYIPKLQNLASVATSSILRNVKKTDNLNNSNAPISSLQRKKFYSAVNNDVQKAIDKLEIPTDIKNELKVKFN